MSQLVGPFFKILRSDLTHYGFTYQPGLNVDTVPFNPEPVCGAGGLYFAHQTHIVPFLSYGSLIARVTLPSDARWVAVDEDKFKADRIVLSDIQPWKDSELWRDEVFCRKAVKYNGAFLQFVVQQTRELCLSAVQRFGDDVYFVRHPTEEICLAAVQAESRALQYITNPSEKVALAAVQQNGLMLQFVPHPTEEICLAAVKNNGLALRYIEYPTEEMCQVAAASVVVPEGQLSVSTELPE